MKWGKKKNPNKEDGDLLDDNEPKSVKKPSTFSLSNLLSVSSSWLSKLKPTTNNNHPKPTRRPPPPTPKPLLFSPPPLQPARTRSDVTAFAPRRLSVGDDDSDLARARARIRTQSLPHPRAHHHSLDFGFDSILLDPARTRHARARRRRRKQRAADPDLKPIRTGHVPDPDPIRAGRRSFSGGRIRPKVRVCSPRLANPNPNLNLHAKASAKSGLESFAVVKSSSDPVRDFRESMVEMIWERGIGRPEELESLLACYLSLNSDEHHDVIVKVFRQVWFDLNREMDRVRLMVL